MRSLLKTRQSLTLKNRSEFYWCDSWLSVEQADRLFNELVNTMPWMQEEIFLFGRVVKQPRLTAWIGRGFSAGSRYAAAMESVPWNELTNALKAKVQEETEWEFNCALVNYYRNGQDSMGMHADDEPIYGRDPVIATVSLGESRHLLIHSRTEKDDRHKVPLDHGSLYVMGGEMQSHYLHGLNKSKRQHGPRISITFRHVVDS